MSQRQRLDALFPVFDSFSLFTLHSSLFAPLRGRKPIRGRCVSLAEMTEGCDLHPAIRALTTVCRCNNVKYRTIERAIRDGAGCVSQIATRTTATTGYCGGSCTPDIELMIAALRSKAPAMPVAAAAAPDAWWVRKT